MRKIILEKEIQAKNSSLQKKLTNQRKKNKP